MITVDRIWNRKETKKKTEKVLDIISTSHYNFYVIEMNNKKSRESKKGRKEISSHPRSDQ